MAFNGAHRQPLRGRADEAHPVHVDAQGLFRAHALGQAAGHIVPVAAVNKASALDLPGAEGGEAGRRGQHILRQHPVGDLLQRQLQCLQGQLLHRHQPIADGCAAHGVLVQQGIHNGLQRLHIQAAAADDLL